MEDKGKSKLLELRQETFDKMEAELNKWVPKKEDRLFYHHPSEDHIVLSHAMFWVMSGYMRGKINKDKYFLLLRKYQERMLDAYLMDSEDFQEQLHYCSVLFEMLPIILRELYKLYNDKEVNKLKGIATVAAAYAGDMSEDQCYELLDDMDFVYNRVKCRMIERMIPQLFKIVDWELEDVK